ncbi:MAG: glycoside hydrolase family 99-like domain-containing protein [Lentisphaerae bacterium]|nr:glycoside hydrolase family 99-like domain-containing protein [Lentisphaerota bacterium]
MNALPAALAAALVFGAATDVLPAEAVDGPSFRKVLFLGNSITRHGPSKKIGWSGNWGMAASAQDKDYVHLVTKALSKTTGTAPQVMVKNIAGFEQKYATYSAEANLRDAFQFGTDLIIVAIGENVPPLNSEEAKAQFADSFGRLLKGLQSGHRPTIVVRSCFWPNKTKDRILERACKEAGGIYVDIGRLGKDESNFARSEREFTHEGVAAHPGDKGMRAIADAILDAIGQRRRKAEDRETSLAPGAASERADSPMLRLRPGLEIACRFRIDKLRKGAEILATKDGEYLLRVDGHEGGHLSFFVQAEGQWEPRLRGPVVTAGTWYDVRAVWTGQAMTMNVNGGTFRSARLGPVSPGAEPLRIGPVAGVIDRLEVRNPSLERLALLAAPLDAPAQADKPGSTGQTILGDRSRWDGWQARNGTTCEVRNGIATGTFPSPTAMWMSPPLSTDLAAVPFLCLDFGPVSSGWTGYVDIVTDMGTGTLSFQPNTGGRPTVISGASCDAWTGTLRRLALSFAGGAGPICIRKLVLADRPVGTPSFTIRSLAAGRATLRPGREETVVVGIQNIGGEAERITTRLSVPKGMELLGQAEQTIPYLGMDDFDMATWRVRAARPGKYTVRVAVSSEGAETSTRPLSLAVEPLPDLPKTSYVPKPRPAKTDYVNLMHYCALWKEGTHYGWKKIEPWPELRPAIGWYDEGTPEVADWHIKYALEHGVNGFIYCWYRAHDKPEIEHRLGHAIHDGLFNAKYRDMFTFTLMWENGCAKGVKDEADLLDNLLPFWIENYFSHPSYLKIDNQPVLFVWQPRRLIPQLGGPAGTKLAFEKMRAQCRTAGFDGLRIIACMDALDPVLGKQIAESGWDAVSGYNLNTDAKTVGLDPAGLAYRDHADVLGRYKRIWIERDACTGAVPDIPNVVMGRDDRPWGKVQRGRGVYIANPKAKNFEAACRDAKALVDAKPSERWDSRIVVFDNWTEFGEGHYIEPTTGTGFTFVNAIKRVFCTEWAQESETDIIPEDIGMSPPQRRYEAVRAGYGDRMPWQPIRITGDLLARWEFETDEGGHFADSSPNDCRLKSKGVSLEVGRRGNVLRCGAGGAVASAPPAFFHPGGVTVSLWCKPSEKGQSDRWMLNTVGGGTEGYRLGFSGGHPVWQAPRERWSHRLVGPKPLPVNEWSHVAATFDNRLMRLYVDGREVGQLERRGFIRPGGPVTIGAFNAQMNRAQFRGWLDSVRVYRRVLAAKEIADLARDDP